MSWQDKINATVLTVVTGDSKTYKPLYISKNNNVQEVDMSAVVLEFNDIEGALVKRGAIGPIGFPFEFIFQGDYHLDLRDEFLESSRDRRAWAMSHPHIGTKIVQPVTLRCDNSDENVTRITGRLVETISDVYPSNRLSARRESEIQLESSIGVGVEVSNDLNLSTSDISTVTAVVGDVSDTVSTSAVSDIDLSNVNEAIGRTNAALSTIGEEPAQYMNELSGIIRAPSRFLDTISNRVGVLQRSYENLLLSVAGTPSLGEKFFFEIAGAFNIIAIGEANLIPIEEIAEAQDVEIETIDIVTRRDVLEQIESLISLYDGYMTKLGELQSDEDNKQDSYIPDERNIFQLQQALYSVIGNLFSVLTNALQERVYTVKKDMPLVVLVHKLLGTTDDLVIQKFAKDNDLGRNDVLIVEKGKEVTYYV